MEWLLLSKIDGHRSVKQIAAAAGMSVFDSAKLLYGLVATNLIRLRPAGPVAHAGATVHVGQVAQTTPARQPAASTAQPAPAGTPAAAPRRAAPAPAAPATPAPPPPLLTRLARLRDECVALIGPVGESVVQKHYLRARADIEKGAGPEALEDALQQIARAAAILKGSAVADAILKLLKS
jgi:hypothetical protein